MERRLHYSNILKPKLHDSFVHAFGTMGRFRDCDCDEVDQSPSAPIDTSQAFFSSPGEWPVFDHQTIAILALFPSTECLSLEIHHVAVEDLRYLDTVFVNFPNIRELRMEHCALENAPYTDNQVFSPRLRCWNL